MCEKCAWCDEEKETLFKWTERMISGCLAEDLVCSKCISMMFEEDPTAITKVVIEMAIFEGNKFEIEA